MRLSTKLRMKYGSRIDEADHRAIEELEDEAIVARTRDRKEAAAAENERIERNLQRAIDTSVCRHGHRGRGCDICEYDFI